MNNQIKQELPAWLQIELEKEEKVGFKTIGKVVNALEQANKIVCERYFPSAPPLNKK